MPEEQPVIRTAFETIISLPFYYGQCDLARIEVALPAGMGARCDLHPHPVSREEGDARSPKVYDVLVDLTGFDGGGLHRPNHTGRGVALPGASPQNTVGDADSPSVWVDVHEPRHEVRVWG